MEQENLNWSALEDAVNNSAWPDHSYESMRVNFEDDNGFLNSIPYENREYFRGFIDETDDNDIPKRFALADLYSKKFNRPSEEILNDFEAASKAFWGMDIDLNTQFKNVQNIYSENPRERLVTKYIPGSTFPTATTEKENADVTDKKLSEIFNSAQGQELMRYYETENIIQESLKAFGRGSVNILSAASGAARFAGAESWAKSIDEYIDGGLEFYKADEKMTAKWNEAKGGGLYNLDWWLVNGVEMMPFITASSIAGGGAGGLVAKGMIKAGARSFYTAAVSRTAGALTMTAGEALSESGSSMKEIIDRGGSKEEAAIAGYSHFQKNMGMLGLSNTFQFMLGGIAGGAKSKIIKAFSVGLGMPVEGAEELLQDRFQREAIVNVLPHLADKINPDKTWTDTFNIFSDQEKAKTFALATVLGFSEPVSGMYVKAKQDILEGKASPFKEFYLKRRLANFFSEKREKLFKMPEAVLTEHEKQQKELIRKHISEDGVIQNYDGLSEEYNDLKKKQDFETAEKILKEEIKLSEMSKIDLQETTGIKDDIYNKNELISFAKEQAAETVAKSDIAGKTDIVLDKLIDFYSAKHPELLQVQKAVRQTLEDRINDPKDDMTGQEAQRLAEAAGERNTDFSKLFVFGENFIVSRNDVAQMMVKVTEKSGNPTSIVEEFAEGRAKKLYSWNGEQFTDAAFNEDLQDNRIRLEAKGYITAQNDLEWYAGVVTKFAFSENPDAVFGQGTFSDTFKAVLESIREFIQSFLQGADIIKEAVRKGELSETFVSDITAAARGEINLENISEKIQNEPEVQEADKIVKEAGEIQNESREESAEAEEKELKNFLENPKGNFELPGINPDILKQLGKTEKPIILKENIVEKNKNNHSEIDLDSSIEILNSALYNPTEIIQSLPKKKPNYYSFVEFINKGKQVQIELSETKDSFEIIGWHYSDDKSIKRQEKRAEREGGEILIIPDNQVVGTPFQRFVSSKNKNITYLQKNNRSMQIISADKLAANYIRSFENLSKAEEVYKKFKDWKKLDDIRETRAEIIEALEAFTGSKFNRAKVNAEAAAGKSIVKVIDTPAYQNKIKSAESAYIRELKKHLSENKLDEQKTLDRLKEHNLSFEDIKDVLKVIKKQFTVLSKKKTVNNKAAVNSKDNAGTQPQNKGMAGNSKITKTQKKKPVIEIYKDNLIENLQKAYDAAVAVAEKLEPEVRYKAIKELRKLLNYKETKDIESYIDRFIKKINNIDELFQRKKLLDDIDKTLGKNPLTDLKRHLKGRTVPEIEEKLKEVKECIGKTQLQAENEASGIFRIAEEKDRDYTKEEEHRLYMLETFANIHNRSYPEVARAHAELKYLLEYGRGMKEGVIQKQREHFEELQEKSIATVSGGKGMPSRSERDRKRKFRESTVWKIADMLENYRFGSLSWEWEMNAVSRNEKETMNLQSWLVKKFGNDVHVAENTRDTGIRMRKQAVTNKIKELFGIKTNFGLEKKIRELSKSEKSGVVIHDGTTKIPEKIDLDFAYSTVMESNGVLPDGRIIPEREKSAIINKYFKRNENRRLSNEINIMLITQKSETMEVELSQLEAVNFWLLLQQERYFDNFTASGWDKSSITQLENYITPEMMKFAKYIQKQYDAQYKPMSEVYEKEFFIAMPKEENYARAFFEVNSGNEKTELNDISTGGAINTSTHRPSSIIMRVDHYREPRKISALDVYYTSVEESEHFKAFSSVAKELRAVFKNENVRNTIEHYFGTGKLNKINRHVDDIIQGGIDRKLVSRFTDRIRSFTSKFFIAWKPLTFIKQLTSFPAMADNVSTFKFAYYTAEFMKNPVKNFKEIVEADFIKNRWGAGYNINIKLAGSSSAANIFSKAMESGMLMTKSGDLVPIIPGYYAVYKCILEKNIKSGLFETQEAAKADAQIEAERSINRTQQASSLSALGHWQRQGSFLNAFQMFQTSQRQYGNSTAEAIADAMHGRGGAKGWALAGKRAFIYWFILPTIFQAVGDVYKYIESGGEDEPEIEDYILSCLLSPVAGYAGAPVITYATRRLFGFKTGSLQITPVLQLVDNAVNAGSKISDGDIVEAIQALGRQSGVGGNAWLLPID